MSNLPTGTVTFLFTDIEGSARRWEQNPGAMQREFKRQEQIIRDAIARHNGFPYKMIGDAFQIAFVSARDALDAAVDAQRALHAENWGEPGEIKVRMALHTGVTEERGDDYVGPVLNRAARVMSAGHGGQILLSEATHTLVRDNLPANVSLRDMGEHRLKDLTRAEHIYQVIASDLPSEFPPLKTLDTPPNNLPVQLTSFIGRVREIAEVKQLIGNARLVTLTGAGGCGKTRLAIQVAGEFEDAFKNGVWWVELAALSDASLVPQAVAQVLGVQESPKRPIIEMLTLHIRDVQMLLVMDNCEHLIAACAELAHKLLLASPNLKILATSREALNVTGEMVWRVPSLAVPDAEHLPSLDQLVHYDAIQLFVQRATAIVLNWKLNGNARAVAQICARLDGIPLAIELAAARLKTLSAEQIAARLDDRFQLLTSRSRTALLRQQTLRATLDWSHDLLSEQERALLRRLSVFAGGWTLEAAETVCSGHAIERNQILNLLTTLVDKSQVIVEEQNGSLRYRMFETIREYAREKMVQAGEADRTRDRHLVYFLRWSEKAEPHLFRLEQVTWLNRFEAEHDNLRAALDWSQVTIPGAKRGLRLTAILGYFWKLRGYYSEGRMRLSAALAQKGAQQPTLARARALDHASALAFFQSDYSAVRALAEESLTISRELGAAARSEVANALEILGEAATETGDYSTAPQVYEQALSLYREVGDLVGIGETLRMLGWAAMRTGNYALAEARLEEGLVACRQSGDLHHVSGALAGLGELAVRRGQYERARDWLKESLDISQRSADKWELAIALGSLGWIALRQHDHKAMRNLLADSLAVRTQTGDRGGMAWCLEKLAEAASLEGQFEKAVRTFGAAAALRAPLGSVIDPIDQPEYERMISGLRTALGEEAFAAAWAEGQAVALEQAIEYALQSPRVIDASVQTPPPAFPAGLTAREVEVLRLLARGLSNQQIADDLVLSKRTVDAHVRSIYGKLDVTTRSAATRAALDQKIV